MESEELYKSGKESAEDLKTQWEEAFRIMCEEHPVEANAGNDVVMSIVSFTANLEITAEHVENYLKENFDFLSPSQRSFLLITARNKREGHEWRLNNS